MIASSECFCPRCYRSPFGNSYAGTGQTFYIWGVQSESGSFPTPYIPTTSSTAARAADNITAIGSLATALGSNTGSLMLRTNQSLASTTGTIIDSNGGILLGKTGANALTDNLVAGLITADTANWFAVATSGISWSPSGRTLVLNNGTAAIDGQSMTPATIFHLGSTGGSSAFLNGNIARLCVGCGLGTYTSPPVINFRSFAGLTQYPGNPIILQNAGVWNANGADAPYARGKIGSTYYAIMEGKTTDWLNLVLYTSTDLLTWTANGTNPVLTNTNGNWDHHYLLHPAIINIGGTWYMYYSGQSSGSTEAIGLATSSDLIHWTKYGTSPIIGDLNLAVPSVIKIGNMYYLYLPKGPTGRLWFITCLRTA